MKERFYTETPQQMPASDLIGEFCSLHLEYQAWLREVYQDMTDAERARYHDLAREVDRRFPNLDAL